VFLVLAVADFRSYWADLYFSMDNNADSLVLRLGCGSLWFDSYIRSDSATLPARILPARNITITFGPYSHPIPIAVKSQGSTYAIAADIGPGPSQPPTRGNWDLRFSSRTYAPQSGWICFYRYYGDWRSFEIYNSTSGPIWYIGPSLFTRHCGVRFPVWPALLSLALISALLFRIAWKYRHPPGHCRRCGYDLRASPERCPECGTAVPVGRSRTTASS
jgi:hypothetical protein